MIVTYSGVLYHVERMWSYNPITRDAKPPPPPPPMNIQDLSHDVASESDMTPCNKFDRSLVDYRFTGNIMTSIITLRKIRENLDVFTQKKCNL